MEIINLVGIFFASFTIIPLIGMVAERVKDGSSDFAALSVFFALLFAVAMTMIFI